MENDEIEIFDVPVVEIPRDDYAYSFPEAIDTHSVVEPTAEDIDIVDPPRERAQSMDVNVEEDKFSEGEEELPVADQFRERTSMVQNKNFEYPTQTSVSLMVQRDCPTKEGTLIKRCRKNIFKPWQPRYFVLKERKLSYYRKQTSKKPRGTLNFDYITVDLQVTGNEILIQPLASTHRIQLRAKSQEELIEWSQAINQNIVQSLGCKRDMTALSIKKKFWKYDRITEQQYLASASTGDILLFRGKNFTAKVQRTFARSKYDHVGILLKYQNGSVGLFEATGLDGVAVVMWNDFMRYKWNLLYSRLIYRHLDCERNDDFIQKLESFIREVNGKKFRINAGKLLKSKKPSKKAPAEKKGFFCSELIAAAYVRLGLLPENVAASYYWPGNFSTEKDLPLIDASLGDELLIDFGLSD